MNDDLLREATRAMRESTTDETGESPAAEFTRERVMRSVHGARRTRLSKTVVVVPLVAVLLGTTAAAAATGSLPSVVQSALQAIGLVEPPEASTTDPAASQGPATTPRSATANDLGDPSTAAAEPAIDPAPTSDTEATATSDATLPSSAPPRASAPPSPAASARNAADKLYRKAHQLHFGQRDYSSALSAWNAYLQAAPRGRFAAEAAYNRGICFARLGRRAEAKRALAPFADGRYGGYRQTEARALVQALGR